MTMMMMTTMMQIMMIIKAIATVKKGKTVWYAADHYESHRQPQLYCYWYHKLFQLPLGASIPIRGCLVCFGVHCWRDSVDVWQNVINEESLFYWDQLVWEPVNNIMLDMWNINKIYYMKYKW